MSYSKYNVNRQVVPMNTKPITIRLGVHMIRKLDDMAFELGQADRSALVRQIIEDYMNDTNCLKELRETLKMRIVKIDRLIKTKEKGCKK